jgi:hypothetical protein
MMQRNETHCLRPWLVYHGNLFGYANLFVIDHGSDRPDVMATLIDYARRGVKVERLLPEADFRDKAEFVSAALLRADATADYDFLLPLDCDEFVTMRDESGAPCCAEEQIHRYLETLTGEEAPLQVDENFLNLLGHRELFFALPYLKVFFTGGNAGTVDAGSHRSVSRADEPVRRTRLVYTHYHHKPYATQLRMSREKLRGYVDVNDRAALADYSGIGRHLVPHLMKSEAEYMGIMRPDSRCVKFPALNALFERLGIDPAFCER